MKMGNINQFSKLRWKGLASATMLLGLAAIATPADAKTLVIARDMDINSLDITRGWCDTCMIYNAAVYDGLLGLDAKNKLVPVIAESWEASADQTTFTFKLNPKAKFSDGSPVEAKDVKWSWERLKNIKNAARAEAKRKAKDGGEGAPADGAAGDSPGTPDGEGRGE